MVAWAASGKFPNAAFLCVCVDPNALATAKEFSQLYFSSAPDSLINGYIDDRSDFPNFHAQLGCQGFIVFNGSHELVAQSTLPWMQYRDAAFRDVEGKVGQLLQAGAPKNPANAPVGQHVRIINLTSTAGQELNGQLGTISGSFDNGRYSVQLTSGAKAFKPENLEDATDAPIGKSVKVAGLTSAKGTELNGQVGEILGGTANGRYLVQLSDCTMALRPENLLEQENGMTNASCLDQLQSVGHSTMDAEHESCAQALRELSEKLTVESLQRAREELSKHFDHEELLLKETGFGGSENSGGSNSDFSAIGSHVKDHKRIISLADDALSKLQGVCAASDALGGTVPKNVASDLIRAFLEHANMYDALYEGKLTAQGA